MLNTLIISLIGSSIMLVVATLIWAIVTVWR
jgi:hypothetical protein